MTGTQKTRNQIGTKKENKMLVKEMTSKQKYWYNYGRKVAQKGWSVEDHLRHLKPGNDWVEKLMRQGYSAERKRWDPKTRKADITIFVNSEMGDKTVVANSIRGAVVVNDAFRCGDGFMHKIERSGARYEIINRAWKASDGKGVTATGKQPETGASSPVSALFAD